MTRIKFKEIGHLTNYMDLLIKEREHISYEYAKNKAKIEVGDYSEKCPMAISSIDELNQNIRRFEEYGLSVIDTIITSHKLQLRLLVQDRDKLINKLKHNAHFIKYNHKLNCDKDQRVISVGKEYLGLTVSGIKYTANRKKDTINACAIFENGSIRLFSVHYDKLVKLIQVK